MNQAVPLNESLAAGANGAAKLAVIRVWLWLVAALIFLMVIVGGATRLTESGLSIVEWKPVTGTLPPLNETQWNDAFSAYKQIPQYRQMNAGMTLSEFKTIFWWEWTHRLLGRAIGAAYLLPFLFFLWRGWIAPALKPRLWFIFGLGAFQGAVGWWMVASGLADRVSVSQYRLSAHLLLATLIFGAIVWTAQTIGREGRAQAPGIVRLRAVGLVIALYLQLYLGALVAGLRAGLVYNTWPLIDGALIPSSDRLWFVTPWWRNLFESALTAQFDHRMLAYAIFAVALWHAADVVRRRIGSTVLNGALILASVVTAQAALGIITLIHQVPLALGLMHQAGAMVALTVALLHAGSMYKGLTAKRGRAAPVAMPS